MEVMETEVATDVAEVKIEGLTFRKVNALSVSINDIINSVEKIPFGINYALDKNAGKLVAKINIISKTRNELVMKYAKIGKDGHPEMTTLTEEEAKQGIQPMIIYEPQENKDEAEKQMNAFLDKSIGEPIKFHKIKLSDISSVQINPKRIRFFDLFNEYIINEDI